MRVLVACEESQVVTKAFREKGREAYSCDIIDCSGGHPEWHLLCDAFHAIKVKGPWDLIIMFPPCTKICVSGNSTYGRGKTRHHERVYAVLWTQKLWDTACSVCDKVGMENPVGVLNSMGTFPKPQYIQPWMFGHLEQKKTGLWLYGPPKLSWGPANVYEKMMELPINRRQRLHYLPPSKDRALIRSKTFHGIAQAMADQWG